MANKPKTGMNDEKKKNDSYFQNFFLARAHIVPHLTTMKIHYCLFMPELFTNQHKWYQGIKKFSLVNVKLIFSENAFIYMKGQLSHNQ